MQTRVTILTGYLGAGKTTLLNALLRETHEPLGVIVNDFGAVNVDASLVAGHTTLDGEVSLQNGCICCTIRGDLLAALLRLRRRERPPGHVVIEASGVSDPASIIGTISTPRLSKHLALAAVVGCVDPTTFAGLTGGDADVASGQLRVCDLLVSTKQDVATPEELTATHERLASLAPGVRVVSSSRGQAPTALILNAASLWSEARVAAMRPQPDPHVHEAGHRLGHHHHHHHHHHAYETWTFDAEDPLSVHALRRALARLPAAVFRAKGWVHVAEDPKTRLLVQVVGGRAELRCVGDWNDWNQRPRSQLVFLGREGALDPPALQRLLEACRSDGRPCAELHLEAVVGDFNRLLTGGPAHHG